MFRQRLFLASFFLAIAAHLTPAMAQQDSFIAVMQRDLGSYAVDVDKAVSLGSDSVRMRRLRQLESSLPLLQYYRRVLRSYGVPPAYAVLPLVESANQPMAISSKGARGLWQLMPQTVQTLSNGARASELPHSVYESTHLASRYLAQLTKTFDHPIYVLAAYNWGPARVSALQKQLLYPQQLLQDATVPLETREYVASVLGYWREIAHVPQAHTLWRYPDVDYFIEIPRQGSSPQATEVNRFVNPYPGLANRYLVATSAFEQYFNERLYVNNVQKKQTQAVCEAYQVYVMREGDTAETITKRFGLNQQWRDHLLRLAVRPGQVLALPVRSSAQEC